LNKIKDAVDGLINDYESKICSKSLNEFKRVEEKPPVSPNEFNLSLNRQISPVNIARSGRSRSKHPDENISNADETINTLNTNNNSRAAQRSRSSSKSVFDWTREQLNDLKSLIQKEIKKSDEHKEKSKTTSNVSESIQSQTSIQNLSGVPNVPSIQSSIYYTPPYQMPYHVPAFDINQQRYNFYHQQQIVQQHIADQAFQQQQYGQQQFIMKRQLDRNNHQ
jgi:hypothetical protein